MISCDKSTLRALDKRYSVFFMIGNGDKFFFSCATLFSPVLQTGAVHRGQEQASARGLELIKAEMCFCQNKMKHLFTAYRLFFCG